MLHVHQSVVVLELLLTVVLDKVDLAAVDLVDLVDLTSVKISPSSLQHLELHLLNYKLISQPESLLPQLLAARLQH